jgi:hypothetical protein
MVAITPTQTVPFTVWEDGSIRITGSRVTLDAIVSQFKLGATAEQIREDFPFWKSARKRQWKPAVSSNRNRIIPN